MSYSHMLPSQPIRMQQIKSEKSKMIFMFGIFADIYFSPYQDKIHFVKLIKDYGGPKFYKIFKHEYMYFFILALLRVILHLFGMIY